MLKQRFIELIKYLGYRKMPYNKYLNTYHWKQLRNLKLSEVDYRCQICYNSNKLHVHHRTYERLGNERLTDLTVLCSECHQLFHDHGKLNEKVQVLPAKHSSKSRRYQRRMSKTQR